MNRKSAILISSLLHGGLVTAIAAAAVIASGQPSENELALTLFADEALAVAEMPETVPEPPRPANSEPAVVVTTPPQVPPTAPAPKIEPPPPPPEPAKPDVKPEIKPEAKAPEPPPASLTAVAVPAPAPSPAEPAAPPATSATTGSIASSSHSASVSTAPDVATVSPAAALPAIASPPAGIPGEAGTLAENAYPETVNIENAPEEWQKSLQRRLVYPSRARRSGWEGRVLVEFTVKADGSLKESKIGGSSGFDILDQQALKAIAITAPFRPAPGTEKTCRIPVSFQLK
jgi:protein TonB